MKNISGAEAVIRCLIKENVDILFGYPGGAIMPVYDELYKFEKEIHHKLEYGPNWYFIVSKESWF